WEGKPSQLINLHIYVACFLLSWLIIPAFYAFYQWLKVRYIDYEVTTQRIFLRRGIINRVDEEVELYRIKDYTVKQPLVHRFFDLYDVKLDTSDKSLPEIYLHGVAQGNDVRDEIRQYVERLREVKKIREVDFQ
ncbi:PH domain-containing protein, partial [Chitinophagales bacterium]|nr:PH domain-containing protein [Chitinophagales bacterium]